MTNVRGKEAVQPFEWLEKNRPRILLQYSQLAKSGDFPHYRALGPLDRRRLFEREIAGLIAYARRDSNDLAKIEEVHAQQARDVTPGVDVNEQIRFLDAKVEAVRELVESDPEGQSIRIAVTNILERGRDYYVTRLRRLEGH